MAERRCPTTRTYSRGSHAEGNRAASVKRNAPTQGITRRELLGSAAALPALAILRPVPVFAEQPVHAAPYLALEKFILPGADEFATPGDTVRLPMGKPHGIFNKSQQPAKTLFWVSPTRRLYDLFWAIHNMKQQNPDDVVKLAAEHNIHFLPPPKA